MKKIVQFCSALALAVIFAAVSANAQAVTRLEVNVPFDFTVGQRTIPAGDLEITITKNSAGGAAVSIIDSKNGVVYSVLAQNSGDVTNGKPVLVFDRCGEKRILTRIVTSSGAFSLPASRRQNSTWPAESAAIGGAANLP